jgi:hypothetical protein
MNEGVNIESHYHPAQNNETTTFQSIENFIVHNFILYENGNLGYIFSIQIPNTENQHILYYTAIIRLMSSDK